MHNGKQMAVERAAPAAPAAERVWRVLHARPRTEKKLAEYCRLRHIEHYLPLRAETKVYQRRKVTVLKPLFPGYLFAAFDAERRADVLKTNLVAQILETKNQQQLLCELDQVRRALSVNPTLGACPLLESGRRVRFSRGPFEGLEGTVATVRGRTRVLLHVDLIGQALAVEADAGLLEPV